MKNRFKFLSFILIGVLISCSNLLDQQNPNALSTDSFWKDDEDVQQAVVGAYSPMSTIFGWGRYLPFTWFRRADEFTPSFENVRVRGIIVDPADIFLPNQWPEIWRLIFRCNDILDNVDTVPDLDQTVRDQAVGQALYLRALYYFYLVNTWDNPPLITQAAVGESIAEFPQPNSNPTAIYEQIILDAQAAKNLLPNDWGDEYGRATWGAATALLGKAYLYTEQWDLAAAQFKEVIDSSIYDLDPNFANNFTENGDNNIESIFEIQHTSEDAIGWSSDQVNSSRSSVWLQLRAPEAFGGEWIDQVNPWILDAFLLEDNLDGEIDQRALTTLAWNHPESTIYLNQPFSESVLDQSKIYPKKNTGMLTDGRANDGDLGTASGQNFKLIRFADVLLMHAEALNESGGSEVEILASLNRVRQRANMPDVSSGLSTGELRDRIRLERVLELSLENDRFFDLKRWGVVVDRMNGNADRVGNIGPSNDQIRAVGHPEENFPFSDVHTRLPFPIAEIQSNPLLNQNPGY
ncbi:RagB/SusD family nutrient uptake outer membrane protein [Flagellimonas sp. 2504JD4-2]